MESGNRDKLIDNDSDNGNDELAPCLQETNEEYISSSIKLATFEQLWDELSGRLSHAVLLAEAPVRAFPWPKDQMFSSIKKRDRGDDIAFVVSLKGSKFACYGLTKLGEDRVSGYIRNEQFSERWQTGPSGKIEYFYVAKDQDLDDGEFTDDDS